MFSPILRLFSPRFYSTWCFTKVFDKSPRLNGRAGADAAGPPDFIANQAHENSRNEPRNGFGGWL